MPREEATAGPREHALRGREAYLAFLDAHGMPRHVSAVHDEEQVLREAEILAMTLPPSSADRAVRMAAAAFLSHRLDDLLDGTSPPLDLIEGRLNPDRLANRLSGPMRLVFEEMVRTVAGRGSDAPARAAVATMVQYSLYGALLAGSGDPCERQRWSSELKQIVVSRLPPETARAVAAIHYAAFESIGHAGIAPFLFIEGLDDVRFAALMDVFCAPMLHGHNQGEERDREHASCWEDDDAGAAAEGHLRLVEIAAGALASSPQPDRGLRVRQLSAAVDLFCPNCDRKLADLYHNVLARMDTGGLASSA